MLEFREYVYDNTGLRPGLILSLKYLPFFLVDGSSFVRMRPEDKDI